MGEEVKKSGISLFRHKIAGLFKDIVEAPPEEIVVKEEIIEAPVDIPEINEEVEEDEDAVREQENERTRDNIHEYIVNNLSKAVSKWKETGHVDFYVEPPVPLRERVKLVWERMKPSVSISAKLKVYVDEVMEKVSSRLHRAESEGHHVDADVVVEEEWGKVLRKIESVSSSSERDEIEKIYKELMEK